MKTIKQIISDADPRLKGVLQLLHQAQLKKLKVIKKPLKFSIKMVVKKLKII